MQITTAQLPQTCQALDAADELKAFRSLFFIPTDDKGKEVIYLCGNSLGLQPKTTAQYVQQELDDWKTLGVEGHFHARHAWYGYHHFLTDAMARLVGALPHEVVAMNTLTVNLHLLMATFYRPTPQRYKILIEAPAFPSDRYAVASQAAWHGFSPQEAVVEIAPKPGQHHLHTEDILQTIEQLGNSLALVLFGGVNYYSGQYFNMEAITQVAHSVGATAGFDLAHAAGNIPMQLHNWNVDFAAWCSYKYLNSGPGGVSGVFVHEKHGNNLTLPRLAGWWGNNENTRFEMLPDFMPQPGAAGWQLSNAQILPMAAHRASLEIFNSAGIDRLRRKSLQLTGYLEQLLLQVNTNAGGNAFTIITPKNPHERGCQLSLLITGSNGRAVFDHLTQNNVVADWRNPNVIRIAPVPLYNTFEDVYRFACLLQEALQQTGG
ncbi:kynureninase [Sphingobacteriales bacterium UPWRP_1]|nr:kynureninase [Sphingobacteriales bacterium TSM_CSS]PSJ74012.1 kynureninase [Sphingobacteriales bacterium UPWRP_1]